MHPAPLALTLALASAAPALARPMPLYRATLAAPATTAHSVRDARWTCIGDACTSPRTAERPDAHVCASMVRKLGPVTAFAAGPRPFGAEELARCNAAAR